MPRFKVGDTISFQGQRVRVVWLSENANEIEAMDEYIVEFEDKKRKFIVSSELHPKQSVENRIPDSDRCERQTY